MEILTDDARPAEAGDERRNEPRAANRLQSRQRRFLSVKAIILSLMVVACTAVIGALNALAQSPSLSEYQIKAGFLYNFAKFIEWPAHAFPDAHAPITIGILGQDPFGDILDQAIKGQTINGRKLAVRRLKGVEDLKACHILFISSSEKKHLKQILEALKASSVLTVGEAEGFAQRGGIIRFTTEQRQVRFEINAGLAEQAGLKISAKLLAVAAKIVRNEHHEGKD